MTVIESADMRLILSTDMSLKTFLLLERRRTLGQAAEKRGKNYFFDESVRKK